jgi:uncharacterized repeat protein (TIGR01451 family)
MKVLSPLVLTTALFLSLTSYADDNQPIDTTPDTGIPEVLVEAPEMPAELEIQNLPRSMRSETRQSTNCYASYLIEKDGHKSARHDDRVVYEVSVTNLGDCVLKNTDVVDYFPKHTRLTNIWPKPKFADHNRAYWNREWLRPGDTARYVVEFEIPRGAPAGWITNSSCAWNSLVGEKICAWASVWWDGWSVVESR